MVRRWLKVCPGPYWQLTDCLLRTCRIARMGLRLARLSGKHDCKLRLTDVCPRHLDRDRSNHTSIWNHHATISRDINRARHFDSDRSNHTTIHNSHSTIRYNHLARCFPPETSAVYVFILYLSICQGLRPLPPAPPLAINDWQLNISDILKYCNEYLRIFVGVHIFSWMSLISIDVHWF